MSKIVWADGCAKVTYRMIHCIRGEETLKSVYVPDVWLGSPEGLGSILKAVMVKELGTTDHEEAEEKYQISLFQIVSIEEQESISGIIVEVQEPREGCVNDELVVHEI